MKRPWTVWSRRLGLGLVCGLGLGAVWLHHADGQAEAAGAAPAVSEVARAAAPGKSFQGAADDSVEAHLAEVLSSLQTADLDRAYDVARQLTERFPQHTLSQLLLSDVSRIQSFERPLLATESAGAVSGAERRLDDLRNEAKRRLAAAQGGVHGMVRPAHVAQWSGRLPYLVVVDARVSRLYLLKAAPRVEGRGAEVPDFEVVRSFYVSFGKNGLDKRAEGDGRTPLGVYHIVGRRTDAELPPLYGHGALTLNYPNPVDMLQGRTGSGIWLHGVPPNQYVRPPFSSDGCVVLANADFRRLFDDVDLRGVPVIVSQDGVWQRDRAAVGVAELKAALQAFQAARSEATPEVLQRLWMGSVAGAAKPFDELWRRWRVAPDRRLGIEAVSLLADPKDARYHYAEFHETVDGVRSPVVRAQYWARQAAGWRLLRDEVIEGRPDPALAYVPPPPATEARAPLPAGGDASIAVRQAVDNWARAWSRSDFDGYLQSYSNAYAPGGGQTRAAWVQERRARIVGRQGIQVKVSNLQVALDGDRAVVRFRQDYRAGSIVSNAQKRLDLRNEQGRWRIVAERVGG